MKLPVYILLLILLLVNPLLANADNGASVFETDPPKMSLLGDDLLEVADHGQPHNLSPNFIKSLQNKYKGRVIGVKHQSNERARVQIIKGGKVIILEVDTQNHKIINVID